MDVKVKRKVLTADVKRALAEEGIVVSDDEQTKKRKKAKEIPNYDFYEFTVMEY